MQEFNEVLNQMKSVFTSVAFSRECRKMNVTKELIANGSNYRAKFLKKYCFQIGGHGSKTWQKRHAKKWGEEDQEKQEEKEEEIASQITIKN